MPRRAGSRCEFTCRIHMDVFHRVQPWSKACNCRHSSSCLLTAARRGGLADAPIRSKANQAYKQTHLLSQEFAFTVTSRCFKTSISLIIGPSSNSEQPGSSNCQSPVMHINVSARRVQNSHGPRRDSARRAWPHVFLRGVQRV